MNRPNLLVVVLLGAGALVTGALTGIAIAARRPDFFVAVLFVVLASATVDGIVRGRVTGRQSSGYLVAFAIAAATVAIATLAVGDIVGGAVLLVVAAGAAVLLLVERRRRSRSEPPTGAGGSAQ